VFLEHRRSRAFAARALRENLNRRYRRKRRVIGRQPQPNDKRRTVNAKPAGVSEASRFASFAIRARLPPAPRENLNRRHPRKQRAIKRQPQPNDKRRTLELRTINSELRTANAKPAGVSEASRFASFAVRARSLPALFEKKFEQKVPKEAKGDWTSTVTERQTPNGEQRTVDLSSLTCRQGARRARILNG
jgi:hypothetical protein